MKHYAGPYTDDVAYYWTLRQSGDGIMLEVETADTSKCVAEIMPSGHLRLLDLCGGHGLPTDEKRRIALWAGGDD